MKQQHWLLVFLTILYPIVSHIAVYYHMPNIILIYLATLLILVIIDHRNFTQRARILYSMGLTVVVVGALYFANIDLIFVPPMLISLVLFWGLVRSLAPGTTPLITRFATVIYQKELPPELKKYTRQCTIFWAIITGVLFLETVILALWAPLIIWSLFCNIINYIILLFCFIAEYIYRIYRFGRLVSVATYLKGIVQINWRQFLKD